MVAFLIAAVCLFVILVLARCEEGQQLDATFVLSIAHIVSFGEGVSLP